MSRMWPLWVLTVEEHSLLLRPNDAVALKPAFTFEKLLTGPRLGGSFFGLSRPSPRIFTLSTEGLATARRL